MTPTPDTSRTESRGGDLFIGLGLMLVGLGFLFHRLGLWHVHLSAQMWPLFPLAFGLARLIAGPRRSKDGRLAPRGIWLIGIGVWGLISEFRLFGLDFQTSWPLLIVVAGLNIVFRSFEAPSARKTQEN